jgi:uroporphyrinogen-III decarboxylase
MTRSTAWEDFLTAARGGTPERVPTALIVDSPWMPGFAGMNTLDFFLYPAEWLDTYMRVLRRFPDVVFLPGFWVEYGMANEPSAYGAGIAWSPSTPPGMRHLDLPYEAWGKLRRPDPETDGLMPLVLRRLERLEQGGLPQPHRIHFVAARGPLTVATHVLGVTEFLEATLAEPEAAHAALEVFTETVTAFLRAQLERLREPLGILLLDDIPGLLSPRSFDAIAAPHLRRILEAFDGLIRIYHNDTPCPHLLSRIGQLPFEVWNFSHEMDIAAVREAVGPRLALLGNVAPLDTLARGTPARVREEARLCLEKAAPAGPFILSAGGGASPGTPAENIDALIEAARAWRRPAREGSERDPAAAHRGPRGPEAREDTDDGR